MSLPPIPRELRQWMLQAGKTAAEWMEDLRQLVSRIQSLFDTSGGIVVKTTGDNFTARTIEGTIGEVEVADGDGVAGNPVISLPEVISSPRKFGTTTDCTEIEADGTLKFNGTATIWNDINLTISSLAGGAAVPVSVLLPGTSLLIKAFSATGPTESAHGSLELLHDYKEGSNIVPHVHWCPTSTNTGNVLWQLEYAWINRDGTIASSTLTTVLAASAAVIGREQRVSFPAISGAGKTIGSRFVFTLYRDGSAGTDTYPDAAGVFDFGVHYEIDTIGSRQITAK